jgi:hypothetical protein
MKNITQTILLGLALCCLMVSNGFGQPNNWQWNNAHKTLVKYCSLITQYSQKEDLLVLQELQNLFENNGEQTVVANELNAKNYYTNFNE